MFAKIMEKITDYFVERRRKEMVKRNKSFVSGYMNYEGETMRRISHTLDMKKTHLKFIHGNGIYLKLEGDWADGECATQDFICIFAFKDKEQLIGNELLASSRSIEEVILENVNRLEGYPNINNPI